MVALSGVSRRKRLALLCTAGFLISLVLSYLFAIRYIENQRRAEKEALHERVIEQFSHVPTAQCAMLRSNASENAHPDAGNAQAAPLVPGTDQLRPGNRLLTYNAACPVPKHTLNIGLVVTVTGRYMQFFKRFSTSAGSFFFPNHNVTIFVFTDQPLPPLDWGEISPTVKAIPKTRLPWPYDSLMRFGTLLQHAKEFEGMDYLYALDVDFAFNTYVCEDFLADLVGVQNGYHPGTKGTPDHNPASTAFIAPGTNTHYYAGGVYGGKHGRVFQVAEAVHSNIMTDMRNRVMALWHDESHLNRYFVDHPPSITLSAEYCYMPYTKWVPLVHSYAELGVVVPRIVHYEYLKADLREEYV
ncbi:hypothetical protein CAOG_02323 [Capsaspora owczarzaki ATCC 30864]|uniref:Uncharacterized protein n=1 Tax=Capsaspora owczarzaki (strain ATCC 30864) TaxID=595528 RepID=A0A0D2X1P0_CAPO3|nr:hypothetical protein CAOG_02323 [Capsaspora owczarzaki ATCC 30864]KJE91144.1 hypothetical protein CAOG_002323 [Capsaspora owczarzaki ATCC 30864]|eukprot:XP_004349073.1 hypothetical protein CAOG_02323 [Capsaspora owczarzaki ATCC 30864]